MSLRGALDDVDEHLVRQLVGVCDAVGECHKHVNKQSSQLALLGGGLIEMNEKAGRQIGVLCSTFVDGFHGLILKTGNENAVCENPEVDQFLGTGQFTFSIFELL